MSQRIKIVCASGTDDLNRQLIARMRAIFPELPLWVVSDFPPEEKDVRWIRWRSSRSLFQNFAAARAAIGSNTIRLAAVMLVPNVPFRRMRFMALMLSPLGFLAFNENLNNFMLRPRSVPAILRHIAWRGRNLLRFTISAARHADWRLSFAATLARIAGRFRPRRKHRSDAAKVQLSGVPESLVAFEPRFSKEPDLFCVTCTAPGAHPGYAICGAVHFSLYDPAKLNALRGEAVSELELGYRAWQRGWVTVSVPAVPSPLQASGDVKSLEFLAGNIQGAALFRRLWGEEIRSLAAAGDIETLRRAPAVARRGVVTSPLTSPLAFEESLILAVTSGDVAVFEGQARRPGHPRVLVASPYPPWPLSHGGAVRMFNLMRRAARDSDQILVCFVDAIAEPAAELLEICAEIVLVRREGNHDLPSRGRPDTVEEFDSPAFRAALRLAIRKWRPAIAQVEFTQMAQYVPDCAPARTLLIEHDVTFDLCQQMLALDGDWEVKHQLPLWRRFETKAWREFDRVVVMSEKDRALVAAAAGKAVVLPNGVDLDRFHPTGHAAELRRLLFIGSFAHLPNLLAMEFFLKDVWPLLSDVTLHIIAGANHEYFLDFYRERTHPDFTLPGVELDGFVSDVRPAYERAAVVVAPLIVSAGTNIKVLEAMAMGKAVVSTPAGVNGLDLRPGEDFLPARTGSEMAAAISGLLDDPAARARLEHAARNTVEREYGWDAIAARQATLYRELIPCVS